MQTTSLYTIDPRARKRREGFAASFRPLWRMWSVHAGAYRVQACNTLG